MTSLPVYYNKAQKSAQMDGFLFQKEHLTRLEITNKTVLVSGNAPFHSGKL